MNPTPLLSLTLSAVVIFATPALAGDPGRLDAKLVVQRVLASTDGREVLRHAGQARPGDLLEYRANYTNIGTVPVRQAVATLPLPAGGTVFMPGSVQPAGAQGSTDGQHFESLPLKRWVTLPDGTREQRLVPPQEYRALRWTLGDLAPGQALSVSARVRVLTGAETGMTEEKTQ